MKTRRSAAVAGLAGLAFAAGLVMVGGGAAHAATTVPYEPDPQSYGTVSLYDASGAQITSGTINDKPMAAYFVGSSAGRAGDHTTLLNMAQPNPAQSTANWNADTLNTAADYPLTSGPANIQALSQTHPVAVGGTGDLSVADFIAEFPNDPAHDTNTSYQNLYQLRLITANGADQNPQRQVADILVSGNTWTQVFPTVATPSTTVLTASPSPALNGQTVTLTATVSASSGVPDGTIQFKDGSSNIGSPVPVSSGTASTTTSFTTNGAHSLSAVFSPTDATAFGASTGTTTETVNPPATPTATTLAVTQDGTAGDDVKLTATVSPSAAAGGVSFTDNGAPISGTPAQAPAGTYTLDLPAGLGSGGHSVVATFNPTDVTQFQVSSSAPQSFVLQPKATGACADPGSTCSTDANIEATVPVGTLVISTPYVSGHPLDVGTMHLTANAGLLTANAPFQNIVVTDTRSGDLAYAISALSSPLSAGAGKTINGQNIGLTGLSYVGSGGYAGVTVTHDRAAADPPVLASDTGSAGLGGTTSHTVVDTDHGLGTLTVNGTLTINAPTSTLPGLYTGTITFTVG